MPNKPAEPSPEVAPTQTELICNCGKPESAHTGTYKMCPNHGYTFSAKPAVAPRETQPEKQMTGIELIAAERERQQCVEGWTPEHDDGHDLGEMTIAAMAYAQQAVNLVRGYEKLAIPDWWPWNKTWWKPSPEPIRNLVKAGALIAAEIDRLQRLGGR